MNLKAPDATVSIIVLSFNRKYETLRCLQSIESQTYPIHEILVLDNNSQDGSPDAIIKAYPNIKLIRMPRNYGDWQGRDIAAANASGDLLFFVDNDGYLEETATENLVRHLASERELAIAQAVVIDPESGLAEGTGGNKELAKQDHYRHTFLGGAAIIRKSVFERVGGFPHYLLGGGEPFVSFRVLDLGMRIKHCSDATLFHAQSSMERIPSQRLFLSSKQKLRAVLSHYPGVLRPFAELTWKTGKYGLLAIRNGHFRQLPWNLMSMLIAGMREWRGDWIIQPETVRLVDQLRKSVTKTPSEYHQLLERTGAASFNRESDDGSKT